MREYQTILIAQTMVKENYEDAGNTGFRVLAKYILGDNRSRTKISMAAPVNLVKQSSGYAVQFTKPKEFTKESLPISNEARIEILEIPSRKVAVYKYSGSWSETRHQDKLASVAVMDELAFTRFNSPSLNWFLRRNEIWFELAP